MPWPNECIVDLPNGKEVKIGDGCNEAIAPDGMHCLHFNPDHHGLVMHDGPGLGQRYIDCRNAPGINGRKIHFPCWVHYDMRCLTVVGPEAGGPANVLFGRFDDKFASVEWVQVTRSRAGDAGAYAWEEDKGK